MSSQAVGAKYVAAIVVGIVSAGTFAGVSHDGRGEGAPVDLETITEVPSPSTSVGEPTTSVTTTVVTTRAETSPAPSFAPAVPATPDPTPTRAPLRSRGS